MSTEQAMLQTAVVTSDNSNDDGRLTWNSSRSPQEDKITLVVSDDDDDENDETDCSPSTSSISSEDDDDDDHSIASEISTTYTDEIVQLQGLHDEPETRCRSILKSHTKSEPRYIKPHRRSWKSLPSPDMDRIMGELSCSEEFETCSLATFSSDISSAGSSTHKRRVSFNSVKIRSYQQTMGDNPAVSYGTPISLDWDFEEHDIQDIDVYECEKGLSRRSSRQMVMSYIQRKNLLAREYGFTEDELVQGKKDVEKTKFLRGVTNYFLPMMMVDTALESAGRKAKRIFNKSSSQ